ncbi:MAG: Gfo/Idh/MocA family oxidoreductase [Candidatus Hydrogenedens sp.]|jgi:predicted dehydrogenase|nr:Gfo/Idh/MocA family oxidoreductase [Candidatus Hydrogenedens sp.]
MTHKISRRRFIQHGLAVGAAAPLILNRRTPASASTQILNHAAIGVTGQGTSDLEQIFSSGKVHVRALCDIDAKNLEKAAIRYPGAKLYRDWREMLAKEGDYLDSINIATPDHMHAPAAYEAMKRKLHVFCEKPLTHEVYEARRLTEAAEKYGVATQMGIQIHSHDYYRTAVHWVKEGAIGKVKNWYSWSSAIYTTEDKQRPAGRDPVPEHVDWDLWVGVAPMRPYVREAYHPFNWRCWRDFGGGATGDFGCHIFDPVFTALNVGAPLTVQCDAECYSEEVYPAWTIANYLFPGTEMTAGDTIEGVWMDGGKKPEESVSPHLSEGYELPKSGSILIGEEGSLVIPHVGPPKLFPEEKFADYPTPELEPLNHYHDFVEAALGNGVAGAHFGFSGPMTEAVLLASIGNRFIGEKLEWDGAALKFTNNKKANQYIKRRYRRGWLVKGM